MWQKYKIIDYQRWHLSDLLQQATFHFFANSAASILSPTPPSSASARVRSGCWPRSHH